MGRFERGMRKLELENVSTPEDSAAGVIRVRATQRIDLDCIDIDWVKANEDALRAAADDHQRLTLDELARMDAEYSPYGFDHTGMTAAEIVRAGRDW